MKIHTIGLLLVLSSLFAGCATPPQTPIKLAKADINSGAGRVGVIMTNLPQLDTQVPGANCLLCLAFAVQSNSALTAHAQTLGYEDLPQFKQEVAAALRKHGATVVVIEEPLFLDKLSDFSGSGENIARKDFRAFKQKDQVDKLLILDIRQLGFRRNYSSYVPTSDPKGLFLGMGYLVNLADNRYEWYESVEVNKGADQNWDEPPKFPGLTNAYYQALEMGKDQLIKPLQTLGGDAVSTRAAAARTPSLPSSNPAAAPKQTDNAPQPAVSVASSSQVPPNPHNLPAVCVRCP
ncbi:MAG: hypothetical protein ACK4F4_08290 [Hylemonella sp.]|uniref:hypothetical protein n=1 Tax=Hylemonella sp. TaxID=2066020 RepID=UPI00391BF135